MIVIRIKTWKDYKARFLNWVREPRQKICKEYVEYVGVVANDYFDKLLIPKCKEQHIDENTIEDIVEMAEKCVRKSVEDAKNLIEDIQPKDLI